MICITFIISFFAFIITQLLILSCNHISKNEKSITYLGITKNLNGLENTVIHTIDDYSNNLPVFLNYLENFEIKSTIFIDRTHNIPDSGWKKLNAAYLSGNEIGSHTRHHPFIYAPISEKTANILLNNIEIKDSFHDIVSHTAQPWVWSFAYPGGEGYQFVSIQRQIQEAGYIVARRFSGFLDMDEQWKDYPRDSFNNKIMPINRYAIKPDKMYLDDYNTEISDFLSIIQKQHRYIFVTHPKGLDYSAKKNIHKFFTFLNSFPNTWFVPLGYYTQYQIASESIKVQITQTDEHKMSLSIENPLSDSLYTMPLTFAVKVQYAPMTISHDGKEVIFESTMPHRIPTQENYFLRQDTLFINTKPRGKIDIVLDNQQTIENIYQKSRTAYIIKSKPDPVFTITEPITASLVQPYTDFRNSILQNINSLKTTTPLTEDKARKITYLYYRIGELDSAFKYLEQSGEYNKAFLHLAKLSVNIARILSWQQNITAADSILTTPLKFKSNIGNEKMIYLFAEVLYTTSYALDEKYFRNKYDINWVVYFLRSSQKPSSENLLLQIKCLDYLIKADSTTPGKNTLLKEMFTVYCVLGEQYCREGLFDNALSVLKKAIEINSLDSQVYNDLGVIYYKKGLFNEAIEEYKKSIRLKPDFALVHYNLALVYFKMGRTNECLRNLNESIRLGFNKINPSLLSLLKKHQK